LAQELYSWTDRWRAIGGRSTTYLINEASQEESAYGHDRQTKAGYYARRADIAAKGGCFPVTDQGKADCVREERDAARQGIHDEYDLEAQRVTSVWTRYMGIAAMIGMGVGIFSLTLIFVTFREARRTADEAKRSADAAHDANRAWLKGRAEFQMRPFIEGDTVVFLLAVELQNVGVSPAILTEGIDVAACVCVHPLNPTWAMEAALQKIDRHFYGSRPNRGKTIFPDGSYKYTLELRAKIEPAVTPVGIDVAIPPDWPYTDDDLVAFIAIGVWYKSAGGEG
jgi:hypothetical protein